jgi:hypothetical protein
MGDLVRPDRRRPDAGAVSATPIDAGTPVGRPGRPGGAEPVWQDDDFAQFFVGVMPDGDSPS